LADGCQVQPVDPVCSSKVQQPRRLLSTTFGLCKLLTCVNPKLRLVRQVVPLLAWDFAVPAGAVFWLLQGERDRDADQVEGLPLGAGRLGEHRDGGLSAGEADLVAGQGGQVLDQAAEAVVGLAGLVVLV
jgi:hypothetical protein